MGLEQPMFTVSPRTNQRSFSTDFVDRIGDTFRWKGCVFFARISCCRGSALLVMPLSPAPTPHNNHDSENCATTEVTEVCSIFPGVEECNVVGVLVPNNQDGRAPMAAITPLNGEFHMLDLDGFLKHCRKNLPEYAVPLFLRITPQIDVTATMKHQKVQLRKEGIDIAVVQDPIYYLNHATNKYEPLDGPAFAKITTPGARL